MKTSAAIWLSLCTTSCCVSTQLPPAISSAQRKAALAVHYPFTVGVQRDAYPVYSEGLLKSLQRSGLFLRVERLEEMRRPPDLVARVERYIYGNAIIPFYTGLTLGIVPTTTTEEWGHAFSLQAHCADAKMVVDFSYRADTTLGLISLIKNHSDDYTLDDVYSNDRFADAFRAHLVSQGQEVSRLGTLCKNSTAR